MRTLSRARLLLSGVAVCLMLLSLAPAGASSANVSHSYYSSSAIANGSIVSLDPSQYGYVELANTDNGSRLLGVTVASNDSLIAEDPSSGKVQIATSGTANTLVSNLNGDIDVGDQIAVSPFDGVGVKATSGTHVIGLAQTAFNSATAGAVNQKVTDKNGNVSTIQLGYVRLSIAVGVDGAGGSNGSLSGLQKLAQSLTGRIVSTPRIIISLLVAIVATVSLVVLIYASIYGSIISIGRNPLAKTAVFRTLSSVLGMALLTAGVASLTIFLLLS